MYLIFCVPIINPIPRFKSGVGSHNGGLGCWPSPILGTIIKVSFKCKRYIVM